MKFTAQVEFFRKPLNFFLFTFILSDCLFIKCYSNLQIIENGEQQRRSSGKIENFYYVSSRNHLQIEFTTDSSVTRMGFEVIYFSGKNTW